MTLSPTIVTYPLITELFHKPTINDKSIEYNTGMDKVITSVQNPAIKNVRALRSTKGRADAGEFLIEGIRHVGEAEEAGWVLSLIIYSPDTLKSEFALNLVKRQKEMGTRILAVSQEILAGITEKENPQGLLAVSRCQHIVLREFDGKGRLGVAVVNPQDPGNVGTILRTLDAVGGDFLLILDGGVDPYHPTSIRASMGSIFWKPVVEASFKDFGDWVDRNHVKVIGSSSHTGKRYDELVSNKLPAVLLLGSEQKGLQIEHLAICGEVVKIPMLGRASSLNLAVAAGILLYELIKKK